MFIVLLTYKADLAELDNHLAAHRDWLQEAIDAGRLLVAGRKVPRTGGAFLVHGTREEVEAWTKTDPFAIADLADYELIAFAATMTAPGLEAFKE